MWVTLSCCAVCQRLAAILGRPALVRETSRVAITKPLQALRTVWTRTLAKRSVDACFDEVILPEQLKQRVRSLAIATQNTKKNKVRKHLPHTETTSGLIDGLHSPS
jgi:hypothetical protein